NYVGHRAFTAEPLNPNTAPTTVVMSESTMLASTAHQKPPASRPKPIRSEIHATNKSKIPLITKLNSPSVMMRSGSDTKRITLPSVTFTIAKISATTTNVKTTPIVSSLIGWIHTPCSPGPPTSSVVSQSASAETRI